jgi:hypothetical protein
MKYEDLIKISDPEIVFRKFHKDHPNVGICFSSRKDKKYMVLHPDTNKFIHFGSTMADYTKNKDEKRLKNFRSRNHKWATADKYTPAYLSYKYLW